MQNNKRDQIFADAINRGMAADVAYRLAYEVPKYATKARIRALASNALIDPSVARLINAGGDAGGDAGSDAGSDKASTDPAYTLAAHLVRLDLLSKAAQCSGNYAAAVAAEVARGKAAGLYGSAAATDEATPERIEEVMRALAERLPG